MNCYKKEDLIAGYSLAEGEYNKDFFTDEEIMSIFIDFFSSTARKDTSYKYVFLKSILDCIDKADSKNKLTFNTLFYRFTEIYWPVVSKYNIRQRSGKKVSRSYVEQLIIEVSNLQGKYTEFNDLSLLQRRDLVEEVKKKCKVNVVGALYGDIRQIFYSFNKKEEWIEFNPLMIKFLKRHGDKIQEKNLNAWIEFMKKVNEEEEIKQLIEYNDII